MNVLLRALIAGMVLTVAACGVDSPLVQNHLKLISAGHTGCMPDDNVISNVQLFGGQGNWNATCKGKVYLCTAVSSGRSDAAYSCAPAQ